jgi:hypothetical protein
MTAAGCQGGVSSVGELDFHMDAPEPKCLRVTPGERIVIVNPDRRPFLLAQSADSLA